MKDLEWLQILGTVGAILVVLALLFDPVSASVRFISKVGSIRKAATIYYRTLKVARPTLGKRALQNVHVVVGIVSACSYASRKEIEPTTTRLLFRGEVVLMLILGASTAVLTVAGVVGLVTGGGDSLRESLMDLVMVCLGAFWCKFVWRDIHRQRRSFADPRYS